jgi:hypothetical protein
MGRKKIIIKEIENKKQKNTTFNRRELSIIKKSYELSVLCDCQILIIIKDNGKEQYHYVRDFNK